MKFKDYIYGLMCYNLNISSLHESEEIPEEMVMAYIKEDEYDTLRDKFGKQKRYTQKQIDSLYTGQKYRVAKVYYNVDFNDKEQAKKLGMRWDPDVKAWFLNVYEKNFTWRTENMFPKPKNLDNFFANMNNRMGIKFKVKDFDYYKVK